MKRMIAFFISVVFMLGFSYLKQENFHLKDCEKMVVVSSSVYKDLDASPIKNGDEFYHILTGDKKMFFENNINDFEYKGLSLYFNPEKKLDYFCNLFCFKFSDPTMIDGYQIYYGYCGCFKDFRVVDGKKINVQLVKTANEWIAGIPLVLTGF